MRNYPKKRPKGSKRGIYIVPNLFTSASLFCGFYAIIASIQGRYETAAIAIIVSCLLDGLDGRIARLTRSTSQFGIEYDSLADLVAFGVAPAVLTFRWALEPFGRLGWMACSVFVICGALRLARFNVQNSRLEPNFFKGLPIPAAATFIASLILFLTTVGGLTDFGHMSVLFLVYVLSFFMVSTIDYPSFKKLDLRKRKPFHVLVTSILILIVIAYKPKVTLFFILAAYIISGPVVSLYRFRKKRSDSVELIEEVREVKVNGE
ncbi:MAG: CDP-diacylglycerol--serine O-phosphatidyltransferase [Desulfatiglans sp.]|jgi:CDP-diacylglycerol--serine O-phosphatidyltransferase|nr:CDP-diacylglycerol--serine O-phosphatidyltransferase [Thermodesulfobacteriota bacterium]MEE4354507.1 CDP-diacylglycerol--serine O-phosphatidyltransferase [Desulfatiglans sp.]